jgi:hypothetical protein
LVVKLKYNLLHKNIALKWKEKKTKKKTK